MTVHRFKPEVYHITFGSHKPVLRISDGDTVITTTVDNAGRDSSDQPVTSRGNPLTGPFYVEDAELGDTLAVHLHKLWPNRRVGRSSITVASNVVDPDFIVEMSSPEPHVLAEWDLDLEKGTATLMTPETNLGRLVLPLSPMLGCLGVAPPKGQSISSTTSGAHGGNMDYRGLVAGVTAYFPVFARGGLLFMVTDMLYKETAK